MEDVILFRYVVLLQPPHVLYGITPFLSVIRKLLELLSRCKFSQFQETEDGLLGINRIFLIFQLHYMEGILIAVELIGVVIQYVERDYG